MLGTPTDWTVYVLECADGSLYAGVTKNFERRLEQHQRGSAAKYTRSRLPVRAVYVKNGYTHSEALKEELRIKALSRAEKLKLIPS